MAVERALGLSPAWFYPLRFAVVLGLLLFVSRPVISFRFSAPVASVLVGVAVFLIWVGPDVLFGEAYRRHWLFSNSLLGAPNSSIPDSLKGSFYFLAVRVASSVVNVPIAEELFWRGWLMRWLISTDFDKVPIGKYVPSAFWLVALLFASEHGPYWEVGLAAGIVYNWWCIRTRNLADCILAHAVTNGLLSVYVLTTGNFQYWL